VIMGWPRALLVPTRAVWARMAPALRLNSSNGENNRKGGELLLVGPGLYAYVLVGVRVGPRGVVHCIVGQNGPGERGRVEGGLHDGCVQCRWGGWSVRGWARV